MERRRVALVAMPCREIVEIGGPPEIFYAATHRGAIHTLIVRKRGPDDARLFRDFVCWLV